MQFVGEFYCDGHLRFPQIRFQADSLDEFFQLAALNRSINDAGLLECKDRSLTIPIYAPVEEARRNSMDARPKPFFDKGK